MKDSPAHSGPGGLSDNIAQMLYGQHAEYNQMTGVRRGRESLAGEKAGMAYLHNLLGQGHVHPHQNIDITGESELGLRHGWGLGLLRGGSRAPDRRRKE